MKLAAVEELYRAAARDDRDLGTFGEVFLAANQDVKVDMKVKNNAARDHNDSFWIIISNFYLKYVNISHALKVVEERRRKQIFGFHSALAVATGDSSGGGTKAKPTRFENIFELSINNFVFLSY